jgi:hypothetical protein
MSQQGDHSSSEGEKFQEAEGQADNLEQRSSPHQSSLRQLASGGAHAQPLAGDTYTINAGGANESTVDLSAVTSPSVSWLQQPGNDPPSSRELQLQASALENLSWEQLQQVQRAVISRMQSMVSQVPKAQAEGIQQHSRGNEIVSISSSSSDGEGEVLTGKAGSAAGKAHSPSKKSQNISKHSEHGTVTPKDGTVTHQGGYGVDLQPHIGGRVAAKPPSSPPGKSGKSKGLPASSLASTSKSSLPTASSAKSKETRGKNGPTKEEGSSVEEDEESEASHRRSKRANKRDKKSAQEEDHTPRRAPKSRSLLSVDYSKIDKCPVCGVKNSKIKGDLQQHYFTCSKRDKSINNSAEELVLLRIINETQRVLRSASRGQSSVKQEERRAEKAAGTRDLGSEDSDTDEEEESDSENQDEYEEEEGSTESSGDSSSGSSESESEQAKSKRIKSQRRSPPRKPNEETSSKKSSEEPLPRHFQLLQRQLQQIAESNEKRFSSLTQRLDSMSQQGPQSQQVMLPAREASLGPFHTGANQADESFHPLTWRHKEQSQPALDDSLHITAMAGWPEMELEEVGVATKFAGWKKKYNEYVSKCTDKSRTPATMAQCFHKWALWFATAFSEQERQRLEQAQGGSAYWAQDQPRSFSPEDVLALTDAEFTRRYLAFCQVRIKDPSQVLQLLSEPKIDVSSGGLVELMQAAQSFTEQLRLVPPPALAQCDPTQVREAFICSLFGQDKLRERKVDYLKCTTWREACDLMIRKASGPGAVAFTPFKPLKEVSSKQPESKSDKTDKNQRVAGGQAESEKPDADKQPDMSSKQEQKWKARFQELATEFSLRNPRHGFASSWKIRYAYLLDCVSQGRKCRRCRTRGHLPSGCDDPLPEVSFPTLSSEQHKELQKLKLFNYGEHDEAGGSSQRSRQDDSRPSRFSHHEDSRSSRPYEQSHRDDSHAYRGRSESQERLHRGASHQDARASYGGSQERASAQGPRDSSVQRSAKSDNCFRCDRPGHRASECKADTHADGHVLQPRSSASRSQSPHGQGGR